MPLSLPPSRFVTDVLPQYMKDALRRSQGQVLPQDLPPAETDTANAAQGGGGSTMPDLVQAAAPPQLSQQGNGLSYNDNSGYKVNLPPPQAAMPLQQTNNVVNPITNLPDPGQVDSTPSAAIPSGGDYGFDEDPRMGQKFVRGGSLSTEPTQHPILSAHERAVRDYGGETYHKRGVGGVVMDMVKGLVREGLPGLASGGFGQLRQRDLDAAINQREGNYGKQDAAESQQRAENEKAALTQSTIEDRKANRFNQAQRNATQEKARQDRHELFQSIEEFKRNQTLFNNDKLRAGFSKKLIDELGHIDRNDYSSEAEFQDDKKRIIDNINQLSPVGDLLPSSLHVTPDRFDPTSKTVDKDGRIHATDLRTGLDKIATDGFGNVSLAPPREGKGRGTGGGTGSVKEYAEPEYEDKTVINIATGKPEIQRVPTGGKIHRQRVTGKELYRTHNLKGDHELPPPENQSIGGSNSGLKRF